ncbi:hypothetical protein DAMA08_051430 [Martiniozyma asiatica (nom. inval.)]|nr:hypothetical protein DAMA08_051430 [Martiniozyma asiatica]
MLFEFLVINLLVASVLAVPAIVFAKDTPQNSSQANFILQVLNIGQDFYAMPLVIGTSNETIYLKIDTTSTNRWVNGADNEFCQAYYPFPVFGSGNLDKFNSINNNVQESYFETAAGFLEQLQSRAPAWARSTTTVPFSSAINYIHSRESEFSTFIVSEKDRATSQVLNIASNVASQNSLSWNSIKSDIGGGIVSIQNAASSRGLVPTQTEKFTIVTVSNSGKLETRVSQFAVSRLHNPMITTAELSHGSRNKISNLPTRTITAFKTTSFHVSTTFNFDPSTNVRTLASSAVADRADALIAQQQFNCQLAGTFNISDSETFQKNESFFISQDDSIIAGVIGTDNFYLNSNLLRDVIFGVAEISDVNIGVLGIGKTLENSTFVSFPDLLSNQNLISKSLYSFQLNDDFSYILFGAIDYSAFDQDLTLFPLLDNSEAIAITLSSIGLSYNIQHQFVEVIVASGKAYTVIDLATKNVYLPFNVLDALVGTLNENFPVQYSNDIGRFVITNSPSLQKNITVPLEKFDLSFNFQGEFFDVPLKEFLVDLEDEVIYYNKSNSFAGDLSNESFYLDVSLEHNNNSTDNMFILELLPSEHEEVVLGLDFLKNMYTVVDLDAYVVGLSFLKEEVVDHNKADIVIISGDIPKAVNATEFNNYFGVDNVSSLSV